MTTLIALASKHALVMGADSLGTLTKPMVDPLRLWEYFDPDNGFKLQLDEAGNPLLNSIGQLVEETEHVPYNQLLHVNKLFKLGTLPVGVMFTGISSVGERTVRSIVSEFVNADSGVKRGGKANYTVKTLAERFLLLSRKYYEEAYEDAHFKPDLELLVAGYDRNVEFPTIVRVDVRQNSVSCQFAPGEFGVAFGGQMDWIQRIVFGTDTRNRVNLIARTRELLQQYRGALIEHLRPYGINDLPPPRPEMALFEDWDLDGLEANWEEFSEQNAIDCVDFFLRIMIGSQDVSSRLPTVGGNVHIAVIRKDGFYPVTREVWTHEDHAVPIPEVGR